MSSILKIGVQAVGVLDMILAGLFGTFLFAIFTPHMGDYARALSWPYWNNYMSMEEALGLLAGVAVLLLLFVIAKFYLGLTLWRGAAQNDDGLCHTHTWLVGTGLLWVLNLACLFATDVAHPFLNGLIVYQTLTMVLVYHYQHTQRQKSDDRDHDKGEIPDDDTKDGLQKVWTVII